MSVGHLDHVPSCPRWKLSAGKGGLDDFTLAYRSPTICRKDHDLVAKEVEKIDWCFFASTSLKNVKSVNTVQNCPSPKVHSQWPFQNTISFNQSRDLVQMAWVYFFVFSKFFDLHHFQPRGDHMVEPDPGPELLNMAPPITES